MAGTTQYKNDWQKAKLDRISLTVPKGKKEQIQGHASAHGESLNRFISRAICETMNRDHIFEQSIEKITSIAKAHEVDMDIVLEEPRFKKIVEALIVLEPHMPGTANTYFRQLYLQLHGAGVIVNERKEDGTFETTYFGQKGGKNDMA